MRILIPVILLTCFTITGLAGEVNTFEQARALAKETQKPVLLDFMTQW